MAFKFKQDLDLILHPYQFVLKEGGQESDNLMDYRLMMLHLGRPETLTNRSKRTMMYPFFPTPETVQGSLPFQTQKPEREEVKEEPETDMDYDFDVRLLQ